MSDEPLDRAPRRRVEQVDTVRASVVVVCFVVALILLLGPASNLSATSPTRTTTRTTHHHHKPPRVVKSKTTVAVANSAGVAHAATDMSATLGTHGWDTLTPTTALGGYHQVTGIYFARGFKQAALDVAKTIGASPTRVLLQSSAVEHVLVTPATTADVVVLLGKDLAK